MRIQLVFQRTNYHHVFWINHKKREQMKTEDDAVCVYSTVVSF